ncbi:Hypothetical Protein FCC1311_035822 [Hondaea fermentalgiana]|uniref:Uncharacterized protein n=1 Tax=Hondaea fermentalgiana TaxID=2315210 RepID=A0A2R5G8N2_9STRA|nr:Hypothetical Protein FCC1311_035822 [Hondaea fermentalgiana]|eukprot:GBG27360.1 Hypothetical Protein FCC1311_035822 [Hondaea fermentalgiana]
MQVSPATMEKLGRFNMLSMNIFALDNLFRIVSYTGLGVADVLTVMNGGKPTPLAQFLSDYYMKITVTRFFNRMFGLPLVIQGLLQSSPKDLASKIMEWSMVFYYPVEHVWLLSILEPNMIPINSPLWSMWSLRAFAVYCVASVYRTFKASADLLKQINETKDAKMESGEQKAKVAELEKERFLTNLTASAAVGDLILALQYSRAEPIVHDRVITLVGIWGGIAPFLVKWIRAAPAPEKKEA